MVFPRKSVMILAFLTILASTCLTPGTSKAASMPSGSGVFAHYLTYTCLRKDASNSVVTRGACAPSSTSGPQVWTLTHWSSGETRIRNVGDNKCLAVVNDKIVTRACVGGAPEAWTFDLKYAAGFRIRNVATNMCIRHASFGSVFVSWCGGNDYLWNFL